MIKDINPTDKTINVPQQITSLHEAKEKARSVISPSAWSWLESGTCQELTLKANTDSFRSIGLVPRVLRDVSNINLSKSFLDKTYSIPILSAPLGGLTQFNNDGELAIARGINSEQLITTISTLSRISIEDIRSELPFSNLIYQINFSGPEEWIRSEVDRAKKIKALAICINCDSPMRAVRYKDRELRYDARKFGRYTNKTPPSINFAVHANWSNISSIRKQTNIPIILKGIMNPDDAIRGIEEGADVIWVSNHGGRSLDSGISTLLIIPEIRAAIKNKTMIVDGGIRTGGDIIKCLAMGADFIALGRPLVYGLAIDGDKGVKRIIELFKEELIYSMATCGINNISDINYRNIRTIPSPKDSFSILKNYNI